MCSATTGALLTHPLSLLVNCPWESWSRRLGYNCPLICVSIYNEFHETYSQVHIYTRLHLPGSKPHWTQILLMLIVIITALQEYPVFQGNDFLLFWLFPIQISSICFPLRRQSLAGIPHGCMSQLPPQLCTKQLHAQADSGEQQTSIKAAKEVGTAGRVLPLPCTANPSVSSPGR